MEKNDIEMSIEKIKKNNIDIIQVEELKLPSPPTHYPLILPSPPKHDPYND